MGNKRVPEIRFPGFTDDWEQRKLKDISNFSKGRGYAKKDLIERGHPIILYGRLYTNYETVIEDVNTFANKKENSIISDGNEVIVPSSGESSEDIARASVVGTPGIILGGDLNIIKSDEELEPVFLALTISNGKQKKELMKRAQGKSIVHLHNSDLKEVYLFLPSKIEQIKIGEFFNQLDNAITLHQQELETLKQTKQGFLQKMFPKKGESVPEIRFPGFTADWEQRRLGDLLIERNEQIPENEDYELMSFVQGQGVVPKGDRYDRRFLVKDEKKKYKKTELGDFIYSSNNLETGSIGFNKRGKAVISPVYSIFSSKGKRESEFIGIMSQRKSFINKMIRFRQGVVYGQWRIHEKDFLDIKIAVPENTEQDRIIRFFQELDSTITLHQRELETLNQTKKAFLQKMFV